MGLKLTLEWFDKKDELLISEETSADLGDDGSLLIKFNLPYDWKVYYGVFDFLNEWVPDLQPLFSHHIDPSRYYYQLSFEKAV
jgi:hypothetical protein